MSIHVIEKSYDIVVVGGGLSGMCAAIAAARHGAKTAIVQNRSVFGGNASSEIRMHIVGASSHAAKPDLAETGILLEMLLENKRRNPYASFPVFDSVMWETVRFQKGLDSYLNTNMDDVVMESGQICTVICHQNTTETELRLSAKIFIDATGHGTLGVLAGCGSRMGTEAKSEFNEADAPDMTNTDTMGNSLMFSAVDRGEKVHFEKPKWAYTFTEEQLKFREHADSIGSHADGGRLVAFEEGSGRLPNFSNVDSGYWWIELGGDWDDIIRQSEDIRDELVKCVYGVWDHLKNQADHGVDNLDLDWVGMVPGTRESRRLEGDYLLNENDVRANRIFEDAVAYGGWQMDQHTPGGIMAFDKVPSRILNFKGCYTIPYRCFCSKEVPNLMMAGRDISTTKTAFGSTRVMGTCAVGGQAAGTAAAMAAQAGLTPAAFGRTHLRQLQQQLLKDDCYIPGLTNQDPADLARAARASASSSRPGFGPEQVLSGIARTEEGGRSNLWCSAPEAAPWLELQWDTPVALRQIRLTLDPDLSQERCISVSKAFLDKEPLGVAPTLLRDYTVTAYLDGKAVFSTRVADNHQRLNILDLPQEVSADALRVEIQATNGSPEARIFEIRAY